MSIAYIIDSSTEVKSSKNQENVFIVPFKGYDNKGNLINIKKTKDIKAIQNINEGPKQYIEPTPGVYRDLYKNLKANGFDYIVVIPQKKSSSSSYVNAEYASRLCKDYVLVIDAVEYEQEPIEILTHLLDDTEIKDDTFLGLDFDAFFEVIKTLLNKTKLIKV